MLVSVDWRGTSGIAQRNVRREQAEGGYKYGIGSRIGRKASPAGLGYTRFPMQALFTGKSPTRVREAPSFAAIERIVKANPGAAGFLHAGDVDKDLKFVLTLWEWHPRPLARFPKEMEACADKAGSTLCG